MLPVFTVTGLAGVREESLRPEPEFHGFGTLRRWCGKDSGFGPGVVSTPELDSTLVLNLSGFPGTRVQSDPAAAPSGTGRAATEPAAEGQLTLDFTGSLQQLSEDDWRRVRGNG